MQQFTQQTNTNIQIKTADGNDSEKFEIVPIGDGSYMIKTKNGKGTTLFGSGDWKNVIIDSAIRVDKNIYEVCSTNSIDYRMNKKMKRYTDLRITLAFSFCIVADKCI